MSWKLGLLVVVSWVVPIGYIFFGVIGLPLNKIWILTAAFIAFLAIDGTIFAYANELKEEMQRLKDKPMKRSQRFTLLAWSYYYVAFAIPGFVIAAIFLATIHIFAFLFIQWLNHSKSTPRHYAF